MIFKAELKLKKMEELAASSLRAGPLAFVSFHCPFLRACVSSYAISLVEKAEENRKKHYERQQAATKGLLDEIGTWKVSTIFIHIHTCTYAYTARRDRHMEGECQNPP